MTSYNNNPEFKKKAIEAAIRHRDMDMLMSGTYGNIDDGFKGCSIGCDAFDITGGIAGDPHKTTADYFGFPLWLERLRDSIFEGLGKADRSNWHIDIKKSIPIGMNYPDFDLVKKDFLIWLMEENIKVVESLDIERVLKGIVLSSIYGVIEALKAGEGMDAAKNSAMVAIDAVMSVKSLSSTFVRAASIAINEINEDYVRDASDLSSSSHKKKSDKLIRLFKEFNK